MASLSVSTSGTCPSSPSTANLNAYGVMNIPTAYQNTSFTVSWTRARNAVGNQSGYPTYAGTYRINSTNTSVNISSNGSGSITVSPNGATKIGFRLQVTYLPNAYVQGGANTQNYSVSASWTLTFPWGGYSAEELITAAKANELASATGASVSATKGQLISYSVYQAIGNKKSITFNSTKPLLSDLTALTSSLPNSWAAQTSTSYNNC